ncbi:BLUF domain-containing protein [Sphingomonas sp. 1P06PA]|uniref:BLUF domain-containing protein n=1 Tax=Sphingomonas sp. 1P06PA TaxID=554121 RepID=UPI0039A603CE
MRRIVYISRAVQPFTDRDMVNLCQQVNVNNRKQGISGLLLFDGVQFCQAIEGDQTVIGHLIERVRRDSRHTHLSFCFDQNVRSRQFKEWRSDMLLSELGPSKFFEHVAAEVKHVRNADLRALFIGFASLSKDHHA